MPRKILTVLLLTVSVVVSSSFAASQGPYSPDTVEEEFWGDWPMAEEMKIEDDVFARNDNGAYAKCKGFGFGIPSGAIIDGILVEIKQKTIYDDAENWVVDKSIRLVKADSLTGSDKARPDTTHWPTVSTYIPYGGSDDLWGGSWTASDINGSMFGVALSATVHKDWIPSVLALVDHVRITVYYTEPPPPTSLRNAVLKGAVIR
ncbi:MAG: hypothetical protein WC490_00985 [Candidatus Margulisiibacteriota bacterium]